MNNFPLFVPIVLFQVFDALLSAALLTQKILLGYTGFASFNSQPNLIYLAEGCSQAYFLAKYTTQAIEKTMKITFICSFISLISPLITIGLFMVGLNVICRKQPSERQQTEAEHPIEAQRNNPRQSNFYLSKTLQFILYLLVSVNILSSLIIFKKYLQYHQQSKSYTCPLTTSQSKIIQITILSSLVLAFSVFTMLLFGIALCRVNVQSDVLIQEKQGVGHQIQRIIREDPDSQRQFVQMKGGNHFKTEINGNEGRRYAKEKEMVRKESEEKQGQISGIQKVESVIYNVGPSLMLQSALD